MSTTPRGRHWPSRGALLAEVMHCRPATPLALEFAAARLEPLPLDGLVLSASYVEAWLDNRRG